MISSWVIKTFSYNINTLAMIYVSFSKKAIICYNPELKIIETFNMHKTLKLFDY